MISRKHSPYRSIDRAFKRVRSQVPTFLQRRCLVYGLSALFTGSVGAQTIVQEYYVPMPEAQIRQSFLILASNTGTTMESVVSVVVGAPGTKVIYDHWEDGYELDIDNPTQSSTQVWGDGNDLNGVAPGFGSDPNGLAEGTVIALRNLVSLPRNPSSVLFDGRDRVGATKGIVMSRSSWATSPGTVLADATEVSATIDWGKSFIMPIGENEIFPTPADKSMFEMVSLFVQAAQNGTQVQIDADANGVAETTVTLNQGENYFLNRGVMKGATVVASKSVQVHLLTGDIGANYESRWFNIPPANQWGNSYYSPVGTASDGDDTYIFLYNPDASAITVDFETRVSSGSFSVPGKGTHRFLMPQESAAHFLSVGEMPFFGIGTVGAEPSSNNVHDWGFSLVPEGNLTTAAVVGWGPGSGDLSVNGNPVWITTVKATRIYVDYDGDKVGSKVDPDGDAYDEHYDVLPFAVTRSYDPDKDQTGMRVYTLDGTLLTAAWGQDPAVAGPGNPYLDVGTTVPAFPVPVIRKTSKIFDDVGSPGLSLGDTLEYSITMNNHSLVALGNVFVIDNLPVQLSYVPGTTERDGVPIPDFADPTTLFPLDESGIIIPILPRKQGTKITYQAEIVGTGTIINSVNTSYSGVSSTNEVSVGSGGVACTLNFSNSAGTTVGAYSAGAGIYVTVNEPDLNLNSSAVDQIAMLVTNSSNGDYEGVFLVETGVNTGIFRNAVPLASSLSAGLSPEDGTLYVSPGNSLSASHIDKVNGEACSATATIAVPSLTKQLYLTTDGSDGDLVGSLDRIDPVATSDASTSSTSAITAPISAVSVDATTSAKQDSGSSLSFSHTVGSNANRLLLVGVSLGATSSGGDPPSMTGVTYGGASMTLVGSRVSGNGSNDDVVSYIYRMINPPTGSANVVVTTGSNGVIIGGATSFSNVHQTTPLGGYASAANTSGSASVSVTSAANERVFSTIAWDEGATITVGSGQTSRWNITSTNPTSGAGSTTAGTTATHTYTGSTSSQDWALSAVAVKPAPVSGGAAATFTQTPVLAESLMLPAGALPGAEVWYTTTSGSMPGSPAITAVIKYGSTVISTSSGATASGGKLTFTFPVLPGNVTVPSGQAVSVEISSAQTGVAFRVDYDSSTKPSKITLPTTTVIHINSVGVYDAPYPGGVLVSTPSNGQTVYVRTVAGDPFGAYDITSLPLSIDGPGTSDDISVVLGASHVVNTTAATKTYEYVWNTGSATGSYTIAATAKEGFENTITAQKSSSVTLSFQDLGTPSITEFTTGENGSHTLTYAPDEMVCVRITDVDQNLNPGVVETITAVITGSAGDTELVTLTETGVDTGIFVFCIPASSTLAGSNQDGTLYALPGAFLEVNYIDPDDPSDTGSDTATVPLPLGSPGISVSKVRLVPSDGQAVVGESVQYRVRTTNTGSTTLSNVSLTDTYPAANLTYVSSSVVPNTISSGTLIWSNVGPLAPGQSVDRIVTFTALTSANPAINSATADAGGGVTSTSSASVVITRPAVTVTKTLVSPNPGPANKGDNVVFNIDVLNSGDTAISSLPLEDTFSGTSFEFVSASLTPDASGSGSLLWLDITGAGSLAVGNTQSITVTLKAKGAADPATNLAAVDFAEDVNGDPVPPSSSLVGLEIVAASISGTVLEDKGASGFGGGDLPISSVTVKLYTDPNGDGNPSDGTLVGTTTTESDGAYEFLNLGIGNYVVVETDPIGFNSVADTQGANDNRIPLELTIFTEYSGNDFLDLYIDPADYGNITGQVRNDTDADGDFADGDSGISGVTIELYTDPNGDGNPADGVLFATTPTTGTGDYAFNLIPPGSYVVVEVDPVGFFSTADKTLPNDNRIPASVVASATNSGNDFLDTNNTASLGTIGDLVWADVDNDGQFDGGEVGVSGVIVQLFLSSQTPGVDVPYKVTTTGAGGIYSFGNVPAGSYVVSLPASNFGSGGALQTSSLSSFYTNGADDQTDGDDNGIQLADGQLVVSPTIAIGGGEADNTIDFGFVPDSSLGSVIGVVSKDVDDDDIGDSGIDGVTVALYIDPNGDGDPEDGIVWSSTTTGTDGSYSISGVPPGSYVVVESQPSGYLDVTDTDGGKDNEVAFVLPVAGTGTADFVEEEPGTVFGHLYIDTNGNGSQDSGEPELVGVDVVITDSADNTQTVFTDGNGDWTAEVQPGSTSANVDENDPQFPTGFAQTEGNDPTVVTAVAGSSADAGIDGYYQPATITGHLYIDTNGNGSQDSGEPDLVGVDVVITDSENNTQTVFTDANGDWTAEVPPGSTSVNVDETDSQYPTGFTQTEGDDPTTVTAIAGSSTDGGTDGYYQPATIAGHLYIDTNGNGTQDSGEPDLVGVDVVITDSESNTQTVFTDANGDWTAEVPPGSTSVSVDETDPEYPTGFTQTEGDDPTSVTAVAGSSMDGGIDGYYQPATITGHLYLDTNGNGIQDSGEPDLAGVDVVITDSESNTQTVFTDANGDWSAEVPPGTTSANVDETDPEYPTGFTQTEGDDPTSVTAVAGSSTDAGIDGYYQSATITGHLYIDTNGNGTQDSGEPDLAGVDVVITDSESNTQTVFTDANGDWTADVPPGTTSVNIDETDPEYPTGFTQTEGDDPTSVTAVAGSSTDAGIDGYYQPATITGHLYLDTNGNGTQDSGEPDLAGVDVVITDSESNTQTVFTDANGDWTADVPPGTTSVNVDETDPEYPTGFTQTEGDDPTVVTAVAGSSTEGGIDGYYQAATITGHLYLDTNGNGTQDSGEPDLAGVDVVITDSENNTQTVFTDANGDWTAEVPPGSTSINVDETDPEYPTGFTQTEGDDPTSVTAVAGSSTAGGIDGYYQPATITGHLYIDTNGNGTQDSGEPDLVGVDVVITDSESNTQTVFTDANGDWTAEVPPGSTSVNVDETDPQYPAGYSQTEGDDPTVATSVAGVSTDAGIDGYYLSGAISGTVFADSDDDGDGDDPLQNVVIHLLDASGSPVLDELDDPITTVTGSNGSYSFGSLPPGDYRVSQEQPVNYNSVSDSDGANNNVIGDETPITVTAGNISTGNDFIEIELGGISGFVRLDTNNDGNGDDVLGGVVLNLLDGSGNPVLDEFDAAITATSQSDGSYGFTGVPTGNYRVSQSQPAGYGSVSDVDGANNNVIGDETPILMTPGLVVTNRDFVEIELGAISGFVLVGSDPLGGVMLTLLDEDGEPVDGNPTVAGVQPITTISEGDGSYTFIGVYPGTYQVGQTQPFGYESTSDADGGDLNIVGDVTPITILPGQVSENNNFIEKVDTCPDNWAEWKAQHPGEEAIGNPDGDDYDNLIEFAFAMDAGSGAGDPWEIRPSSTVSGGLDAVFTRPKGAPENVVYLLEYSATLGNPVSWTSVEITPSMITGVVDNGDCTETITIADIETVTGLTGGTGVARICAALDEENDDSVDHMACTHVEGWKETAFGICCQSYSNPYLRDRLFTGTIESGGVSGQTLDFTTSAGAVDLATLLAPGSRYFLEVASGENEGHRFDVVSASGAIVTLAVDSDLNAKESPFNTLLGALPSNLEGDEVVIRRHWTLDEVFPPSAFGAAASELDADQVQVHSAGAWTIYWLSNDGGTPHWVDMNGSMADMGETILPPGQGVFFNSRNAPSSLLVYGEVRENDFRRPLTSGLSLVSGGYPMDQSATGSSNREMSLTEGFFGSLDFKTADSFFVWRGDATPGTGNYDTYYLANGAPSNSAFLRWVRVGDASATPRGGEMLLFGNRSIFVRSAAGLSGYGYPIPWTP